MAAILYNTGEQIVKTEGEEPASLMRMSVRSCSTNNRPVRRGREGMVEPGATPGQGQVTCSPKWGSPFGSGRRPSRAFSATIGFARQSRRCRRSGELTPWPPLLERLSINDRLLVSYAEFSTFSTSFRRGAACCAPTFGENRQSLEERRQEHPMISFQPPSLAKRRGFGG